DIVVNALLADGSTAASTTTASDGTWLITGLAAATYRVQFVDVDSLHTTQYYNNQPTFATAAPIALSGTSSNINATMVSVGVVSGTVTDDSGVALAGITVTIYKSDNATAATATSTADGT